MRNRLITSAVGAAALAVALVPATATATASAASGHAHSHAATVGRHHITADATYAFAKAPAKGWTGRLYKKETFDVKRYSPSGKWAYGHAYGHINRSVWVKTSAFDARAAAEPHKAHQASGRRHVKVASTYVYAVGPAKGISGTLFKDNTFDIKRYSPSRTWAFGHAFGHVNRNVWVKTSALGL